MTALHSKGLRGMSEVTHSVSENSYFTVTNENVLTFVLSFPLFGRVSDNIVGCTEIVLYLIVKRFIDIV